MVGPSRPRVDDADDVAPSRHRLLLVHAVVAEAAHARGEDVGEVGFVAYDAGNADDLLGEDHRFVDIDRVKRVERRS